MRVSGAGTNDRGMRHRQVGVKVIIGVAGAIGAIAAWAQLSSVLASSNLPAQQALAARSATGPESLFARCTRAMVQGSCQVMGTAASSPAGTSQSSQRVFVAGVGEVDAAVYERLRRLGDAMCSDVQRACEQDWQGSECRVAQALYPPTR